MVLWRSIVCGVDERPECAEAVRLAARLAKDEEARLVLLHVLPDAGGEPLLAPPPARASHVPHAHVPSWPAIASDLRGEPVRLELSSGDPAKCILALARAAGTELIVLARPKAHRTLGLTSVARKVLARAPCPVLIVPVKGEERLGVPLDGPAAAGEPARR